MKNLEKIQNPRESKHQKTSALFINISVKSDRLDPCLLSMGSCTISGFFFCVGFAY